MSGIFERYRSEKMTLTYDEGKKRLEIIERLKKEKDKRKRLLPKVIRNNIVISFKLSLTDVENLKLGSNEMKSPSLIAKDIILNYLKGVNKQ